MNQQPSNEPYTGGGGSGISPRIVVGGVIAVLLLIFVIQNRDSTQLDFLVFSFSAPLWLILVIMVVLGMLLKDVVVGAVRKARGKSA